MAAAAMRPLARFESHKVNAPLTPAPYASSNATCAASNPKCCSKGAVTIRAAQRPSASSRWASSHAAVRRHRSGENLVEEMTSGAVLHLEDPGVGVEAQ